MPDFDCYDSTSKDISLAQALPWHECPRRYCWWWQSLSFDWNTSVVEGCRYVVSEHPPNNRFPTTPCVRCDPSSRIDQYEPREPHLVEDGFDEYGFTDPRRISLIKKSQDEFQKRREEIYRKKLDDNIDD